MSIRILPETEIKQAASSFQNPPLLFANPKNLYFRRAKRLRQLAENNPFGDYLEFAANLTEVQLDLLESHPIANYAEKLTACIEDSNGQKPLNAKTFKRSSEWRDLLFLLTEKFKPYANDTMLATIELLEKSSTSELEALANDLLNERYEAVGADKAVFLWAALSLYWTQLAQQLPRNTQTEVGERHTCPVCDSAPIVSVVHFGDTQGLRYLHCSLCESEWNMVRSQCSVCDQSGKLDYWSIDSVDAAVKAESCGDCESYLKVLYQEKDPHVEPVADDLGTLFLDAEMEQKGFAHSGLNPFLFQVE
ncbi:formate dehydrogenase accessory protein FdhE [Actinobacillus pleuropneumoniae]|uniref:formate dehydrogenase accessory protein FdhE n=1 Tax=Actinobacillus pleuropneumoniae TaxID=715 RepID=UPI001F420E42|nr:formate dehydrogenase accessory protein FdhE [Actinobacillus pleuropneumoniae]UKH21515.1 formate dehydrogenase accessory protein FdhE [Actinobacillus pleuropneumoniae]UPA21253.1 formate dehydrogenase accessory protein FdhE [Actinobacillus pleuropneumoniae]